jgi:Asp-tRNA(Asn)/Glu-tRNA(Gln) amidotransferase A subunit family amidase
VSALDLPLREQAAAIAAGDADPSELLDDTLERIEARNPELNAIVEVFPERSREMLAAAPRGPLHGVPVVIKDEWPLPWRAERLGAAEMLSHPSEPGESGPYRRLRDAGAVIVGVANMHEYGAGSTGHISVYGPARNPWDTSRCPGGSSSGPGSAVGGRLVAGAVGADGIGSIRYPSAYCGITGLKPTFRRSAMGGHAIPQTTTIVSGPMCPDAADCRLLGAALFGEELSAGDAGALRIGTVAAPVWDDCREEVREACERAIEALRAETEGETAEVEIEGMEHVLIASILVGTTEELADIGPRRVSSLSDEVSAVARALLKYRLLLSGAAISRAHRVRSLVRRSLARAFERVDVIAWPTVPAPAPPLDNPTVELPSGPHPADWANARSGGIANLTGVPAISVPVGLSSEGLPIGLQLLAAWGREELLLDAAEALERATGREQVEARPAIAAVAA